ncbi:MAG: hypothetical protein FWC38_06065 [Proteobacteria bacterium]|nr:hypothetical protein [Pseudomonadota bacterium]
MSDVRCQVSDVRCQRSGIRTERGRPARSFGLTRSCEGAKERKATFPSRHRYLHKYGDICPTPLAYLKKRRRRVT